MSESYSDIARKLSRDGWTATKPINPVGAGFYELSSHEQAVIVAEQRKGKVV